MQIKKSSKLFFSYIVLRQSDCTVLDGKHTVVKNNGNHRGVSNPAVVVAVLPRQPLSLVL